MKGKSIDSEDPAIINEDTRYLEKIKIRPLLYILIMVFAWGSWIDINSIFSQYAMISSILPESEEFGSYFSMIIQIANIVPLFYVIGRRLKPAIFHERPTIIAILLWGTICLILIAFTYDKIVVFKNGKAVGFPLLFLCFTLAVVDTTSTLTFLPYMALFPPAYLSAFFLGMSLSSLLPGILAIIQQTEAVVRPAHELYTKNALFCARKASTYVTTTIYIGKLFSTRTFFLITAFMMAMSLISFFILNFVKKIKVSMIKPYNHYLEGRKSACKNLQLKNLKEKLFAEWNTIDRIFFYHLLSITIASFIGNGVIVQLPTLLMGSYGGKLVLWANNLSLAAAALTSIAFLWKSFRNHFIVLGYAIAYIILSVILICIISLAKHDILLPEMMAKPLIVFIFIFCGHIGSAIRQVVCSVASSYNTERMLICSIFIQVGSFLGSLTMFIPISILCVFST